MCVKSQQLVLFLDVAERKKKVFQAAVTGGTDTPHSGRGPLPIDLTILWLKQGRWVCFYFAEGNYGAVCTHGGIRITRDGKVRECSKADKSRRGIEIIKIRYVTEKNEECQWRIGRRFSRKRKSYVVSLR